jgi:hypothetical protein
MQVAFVEEPMMISKNVMGMLTTGPIPDPEPARNPALTPCLRLALSTP